MGWDREVQQAFQDIVARVEALEAHLVHAQAPVPPGAEATDPPKEGDVPQSFTVD